MSSAWLEVYYGWAGLDRANPCIMGPVNGTPQALVVSARRDAYVPSPIDVEAAQACEDANAPVFLLVAPGYTGRRPAYVIDDHVGGIGRPLARA